jgi:hypothetical protein
LKRSQTKNQLEAGSRQNVPLFHQGINNKGLEKLCNEEHILHSPDIIRIIKSRRVKWIGHAACIEEN